MLKRLWVIALSISLAVGMPLDLSSYALAAPTPTDQAAMSMDHTPQQQEAPKHHRCCECKCSLCSLNFEAMVCPIGVLPLPVSLFVLARWGTVSYPALNLALRGRSVKPELFPPILTV
jgi:hypothetical protein